MRYASHCLRTRRHGCYERWPSVIKGVVVSGECGGGGVPLCHMLPCQDAKSALLLALCCYYSARRYAMPRAGRCEASALMRRYYERGLSAGRRRRCLRQELHMVAAGDMRYAEAHRQDMAREARYDAVPRLVISRFYA